MFYSQFILAKKGPLGTIWIAAHLERKLRKNQVADTDIGVSVDSILFPEVPIALRLSSHLLLGVVRIYSRKVNYLFDDCSEALLKIKQAFRSTAVDLPPEESTAPYHSITLPETFDLDDFELPDNDFFQGNYVDHHVSSKEQITLQDTMDGVVYSTSQFGLDERFGDGDTSQIGLDLDEELFMDKVAAPGHAGDSTGPQTSAIKPSIEDENNEEMNEASEAMAASVSENQLEALATSSEFRDYAQAPSTPVLVEEPNLSNAQKAMACDDHLESDDHNSTDLEAIGNVGLASCKSDHYGDKSDMQGSLLNKTTPDSMLFEENGCDFGGREIQQSKPEGDVPSPEGTVEDLQNGFLSNNGPSVDPRGVRFDGTVASPSLSHGASEVITCLQPCSNIKTIPEQSSTHLNVVEGIQENDRASLSEDNIEDKFCHEPTDPKVLDEGLTSTPIHVAQVCDSQSGQPSEFSVGGVNSVATRDLPSDVDVPFSLERSGMDEAIHDFVASTELQGTDRMAEPNFCEGIQAESPLEEKMDNVISKYTIETPSGSVVSELPAAEKLLSMPEGPNNLAHVILVDSTPDKVASMESEGYGTGIELISGKKRSFTESTLTLQSLNSDESFAKPQSKQTAEFIPDDDDLLSSILVGRRTSILKTRPTPTPPEVVSTKRPRTAPRVCASKRKVLMDDAMVLHGDTIREQLMSTEDIRRVRKKAPSTRQEIWMIQKQFLEEGIFNEPICTGMSAQLLDLHNQTYDLRRIRISQNDESIASLDYAKDTEPSVRPNAIKETETEGSTETSVVRNDGEAQPARILVHNENQQGEDNSFGLHDDGTQVQMEATSVATKVNSMNHELWEIAEMEIDVGSVEVTVAAESAVPYGFESSSPTGHVTDAYVEMNALCQPSDQKLDSQFIGKDASELDLIIGNGIDSNIAEIHNDNIIECGTESRQIDEYSLKGHEGGKSVEIRADVSIDSSAPTENASPSFTVTLPETGQCEDLTNQPIEGIAKSELEFVKEDSLVSTELVCDDKNEECNLMYREEHQADSLNLVEFDVKSASLNGGENTSSNDFQNWCSMEAEAQGIMDMETIGLDHSTFEDHGAMDNVFLEHDTEFLNVDDDEIADEDDNYTPGAEETRALDNSGWSSRSRAVAKYLQTLFDKEAEHGKKIIPMENLLSGKTRKEASRMFFETLVLKTRDYIHVEQETPYDNIKLKPRGKLMKSEF